MAAGTKPGRNARHSAGHTHSVALELTMKSFHPTGHQFTETSTLISAGYEVPKLHGALPEMMGEWNQPLFP